MNVLILDGHPDSGRLISGLLDHYEQALPANASIERINIRDLAFASNLQRGYAREQPWEPDLQNLAAAVNRCDHLVVGFPLWWGAEPALLKGLLDRLLVPGFAFRYHRQGMFWDRLLAGRSADVFVTMDTPPWYLRLIYADPVGHRWRRQVLGFCGFAPIRIYRFGITRRGGAAKRISGWHHQLTRAAQSAAGLKRAPKNDALAIQVDFAKAAAERQS